VVLAASFFSSLQLVFSLETILKEIKQQQNEGDKYADHQKWVEIPKVGHDHVAQVGDFQNPRHDLLVGETENDCACQQSQDTRDEIIQFSFAGPGGTGTRSVPGQ
jgi:hypothetical protein